MHGPGAGCFYAQPGPITALKSADMRLAALPGDPDRIWEIVQGLVIHGDFMHLYGLDRAGDPAEMHLRPVSAMLDALLAKCDLPLATPRAPGQRLIGSCRHFAVLVCAILRAHGTPCRVRCGFASYFEPGSWEDHWIAEYWCADSGGWRRVDAELDTVVRGEFGIAFDPGAVPEHVFLPGPVAWRRYRCGEADAGRFGYLDSRGPKFIASTVVRDLAALNKHEMLPWDYWGCFDEWDRGSAALDEGLIDEASDVILDGELPDIQQIYDRTEFTVAAGWANVRADR